MPSILLSLGRWWGIKMDAFHDEQSVNFRMLLPSHIALLILVVIAMLATLAPYAEVRMFAGSSWSGVMPEFAADANFYISRAKVVAEGHLLGSNPYLAEHVGESFPSSPIPDIIA